MYIDIYIDSFILTLKKIHFLLSQIEKKNENMKKKIIDYLIDYACPIISDNRLWNFSDCTSLLSFKNISCKHNYDNILFLQHRIMTGA